MSQKTDIRNDSDIRLLIDTFYAEVERDERLGYIFNEVASVDWKHHLPRMVDFWSHILFQTGRFNGRPFRKHMPLPIVPSDFELWLGLFFRTVDDLFEGERADHAKETAAKIASAFLINMRGAGKFDNLPEQESAGPVKRE